LVLCGVMLAGMVGVLVGMGSVSRRGMGGVGRLLVMTRFLVFGRFGVVGGGVFVAFGCLLRHKAEIWGTHLSPSVPSPAGGNGSQRDAAGRKERYRLVPLQSLLKNYLALVRPSTVAKAIWLS